MAGLTLYVARTTPDCSNNGISSRRDRLTLVGTLRGQETTVRPLPMRARIFAPSPDAPAVAFRLNESVGTVHVVPVVGNGDGTFRLAEGWHMSGGNFAAWSDARIGDAIADLLGSRFYGAAAIHDRVE